MPTPDELRIYANRVLKETKAIGDADYQKRNSLPLSALVANLPPEDEKDGQLWAALILLYHTARDYREKGGDYLNNLKERVQQVERLVKLT